MTYTTQAGEVARHYDPDPLLCTAAQFVVIDDRILLRVSALEGEGVEGSVRTSSYLFDVDPFALELVSDGLNVIVARKADQEDRLTDAGGTA